MYVGLVELLDLNAQQLRRIGVEHTFYPLLLVVFIVVHCVPSGVWCVPCIELVDLPVGLYPKHVGRANPRYSFTQC